MRQLAVTADRRWTEIAAFIDTEHDSVDSKGINRVIKLVARVRSASATPRTSGC
ncbi:hypothetical protein [Streptomyces sp. KHY 26]|uniref:hypothetical protein n=1 Tax=Streptomyces sp. KHY 26 TaxID=3097359 RepID=UPI00376EEF11